MGAITREAVYFPAEDRRLFGWLHCAPSHSSDTGLVICKPFGYEAICGHRTFRAFAEAAAAAGFPTLRFDYLGTGDSGDIDAAADQIEAWSRDILAAVDEVRGRTGVRRVCLLGWRRFYRGQWPQRIGSHHIETDGNRTLGSQCTNSLTGADN